MATQKRKKIGIILIVYSVWSILERPNVIFFIDPHMIQAQVILE